MKVRTFALSLALTLAWITSGSEGKPAHRSVKAEYLKHRAEIIAEEQSRGIGAKLKLTPDEQVVNDRLMQLKQHALDDCRLHKDICLDTSSFFLSRKFITDSRIYKFIQKMPKGAALHVHDFTVGDTTWVVKNATYAEPLVKMCRADGCLRLSVHDKVPPKDVDCEWKSVAAERAAAEDIMAFDLMLAEGISMMSSDPTQDFSTVPLAWEEFTSCLTQVLGLILYAPVMKGFWANALQDFYDDNVQYMEMRINMDLGRLFELDQPPKDTEYGLKLYKQVVDEFMSTHPDFMGVKFITSSQRSRPDWTVDKVLKDVKTTMDLLAKYPNDVLGFDMVGYEDMSYPLKYYLDALMYPSQQDPPVNMDFFFHVGESNWQDTEVDYNILDAIMLNASRIGHGYALIKHPTLAAMVKERDIAVEINPISNQQLGLVKDFRNHALIPLLADQFPVVISSDDRFLWGAAPMSHDYYVAFMVLSGREADLSLLKQLALNSIKYSKMSPEEKQATLKLWQAKWDLFIQEMLKGF